MDSTKLFDLQKLIEVRHHIHKHPESAFQEFETSKLIKNYLLNLEVNEKDIRHIAKTGLMVDIKGTGQFNSENQKIVAFRSDIDALEMIENNPTLEYRSTNNCAHMCGHDGHIACLLGGISLLLENLNSISSKNIARFLFQPAEESLSGAKQMIKEGCLEGVFEVWGLHNVPFDPPGKIIVKSGFIMSGVAIIHIKVKGKGGHSSLQLELNNPTIPACDLILEIEKILNEEFAEWNKRDLIVSFPAFL